MKKEQAVRIFRLTDAVLKQKADEYIALLDRDFTEFADRGYNAAKKAELVAARDTVESFPNDEQLESIKMNLTEQKDAARKALEKTMRSIFNMAENVFGQYSAKHREFGDALISQQSDAEIVRVAKIMSLTAEKYLAELSTEGLTREKIDILISQRNALDVAIDAQAQGISDRDLATEGRVEALNILYQLLIKYAGIGQDIFYETNEAKYNDYIIYDTPSGLPEVPPMEPV